MPGRSNGVMAAQCLWEWPKKIGPTLGPYGGEHIPATARMTRNQGSGWVAQRPSIKPNTIGKKVSEIIPMILCYIHRLDPSSIIREASSSN